MNKPVTVGRVRDVAPNLLTNRKVLLQAQDRVRGQCGVEVEDRGGAV